MDPPQSCGRPNADLRPRPPRKLKGLSAVVAVLGFSATAGATPPTIRIDSPVVGSVIANMPKPTISVSYEATDSQPLNLTTLKITVAGGDVTGRFTVSPTGASWTLGVGDDLEAGSLTITASIANALDEETTTSATVSVRPTFTSILPEAARVGDLVEIRGFGLSPDPAQNAAVFSRAASTPPIIVVPFESVAAGAVGDGARSRRSQIGQSLGASE